MNLYLRLVKTLEVAEPVSFISDFRFVVFCISSLLQVAFKKNRSMIGS